MAMMCDVNILSRKEDKTLFRVGFATDQKNDAIFGISVEKSLGKGGGWF